MGLGSTLMSIATGIGDWIGGNYRAEQKFKRDKKMWNLQNEYNHPAAQMSRFKEAGLNPNMMYGHGTPGLASSPPEAPTLQPVTAAAGKTLETLGAYQNTELQKLQLDNVAAQTENIRMRTATETINQALKVIDLEKREYDRETFGYTYVDKDGQVRVNKTSGWSAERRKKAYIADQAEERARISGELSDAQLDLARTAADNAKKTGQLIETRITDTQAAAIGKSIRNQYDQAGVGINTPYEARLLYKSLKDRGLTDEQITIALTAAGISANTMKSFVPKISNK